MKTDPPPQLPTLPDFISRIACKEPRQRNAPFHPRKGQTDADMRTTRKGKMPVGVAGDIKRRGVIEHRRVAVGGTDAQMQIGACGDWVTAKGYGGGRLAIAELVGGPETQHFLDGRVDQRRVAQQFSALVGVVVQQGKARSDQVRRGFMARVEDENTVLDQLDFRERPAVVAVDQTGQHIGFGITGGCFAARDQVLKVGFEIPDGLVAAFQLRARQRGFQRAEDGEGPVAQGAALGQRHVKQVADDLDGNGGGEIFDQIGVAGHRVEQLVDDGDQAGFHPRQRLGREGGGHDAAHAGVQGRIVEHEAGGVVFEQRRSDPEFRRKGRVFVGDISAGVTVDRVQISVAGDQERPVRLRTDGGVGQQLVVMGKGLSVNPSGGLERSNMGGSLGGFGGKSMRCYGVTHG